MKGKIFNKNEKRKLQIITEVVCEAFGIDPKHLQTIFKVRELAEPRFVIYDFARRYTNLSEAAIAGYFKRDHSNVPYAIRKVDSLKSIDSEFKRRFDEAKYEIINRLAS